LVAAIQLSYKVIALKTACTCRNLPISFSTYDLICLDFFHLHLGLRFPITKQWIKMVASSHRRHLLTSTVGKWIMSSYQSNLVMHPARWHSHPTEVSNGLCWTTELKRL